MRQIEEISRRAQSAMLDVVAEADARGIAARQEFGTTPRLLAAALRLSAADARTRTEQAATGGMDAWGWRAGWMPSTAP